MREVQRSTQPADGQTAIPPRGRFEQLLGERLVAELEVRTEAVYGLWPDLTIAYVNPAWRSFIERHDGALAVARRWRLGSSVLDAFDQELRGFYARVLRAALSTGRPWTHEFDCSGRAMACRYQVDVRPLSSSRGLLVTHAMLAECPHSFAPCCAKRLDAARYQDSHGLVVQCIHCRRVRQQNDHERWDLVPAWVERTPDHASGGLCTTCARLHFPALEARPGPRPAGEPS